MNEVIGLKIKELRKEKKITQKVFSAQINIDDSQLSKIEKGKLMPTLSQLLEISSIFKVSLDWLTGKEEINILSSQTQENDKYISSLEKINALQEKEIKRLEKEIERLKGKDIYIMEEKIENQRKEINALKSQNTGTSTAFSSSKRV